MKRKSKIYLFKGTPKEVQKANALMNRVVGMEYISVLPMDMKIYFAFELSEKLNRKLKVAKLSNKVRSKKMISLVKLVSKCKSFESDAIYNKYKDINRKPPKNWGWGSEYRNMPTPEKKDNQKIHDKDKIYSQLPDLDKMSKSQLIKLGNKIRGIKVRRPRKTASRRTWKNFIERFYTRWTNRY